MAVEPPTYEQIRVAQGVTLNVCERCGAFVQYRMIHDAWHVSLDEWAVRVTELLK